MRDITSDSTTTEVTLCLKPQPGLMKQASMQSRGKSARGVSLYGRSPSKRLRTSSNGLMPGGTQLSSDIRNTMPACRIAE